MSVKIRNVHPHIGAEILGVDLSSPLSAGLVKEIKDILDARSLVLFRDQGVTPRQMADFSAMFGKLRIHDLGKFQISGVPEVTVLSNILNENGEQVGFVDVGQAWHTDASFMAEPHMYSFLHAIEIPVSDGKPLGSTWFVSTAHAYETLPGDLKERISGLKSVHRFDNRYEKHKEVNGREASRDTFKGREKLPDAIHPIVRTHPSTGTKCIYVNELATAGIVGMDDSEARPLLDMLYRHCTKEEEIYRHQWKAGDFLIWDNSSSQHMAIGDYKLPQRRMLWKTTIHGSAPF